MLTYPITVASIFIAGVNAVYAALLVTRIFIKSDDVLLMRWW